MSDRALVLVLSNDFSLAAAKTSRHLALALEKIGFNAICRDTSLVRWSAAEAKKGSPARLDAYETAVAAKWDKFICDYGVTAVISLDLHWLFSSRLFFRNERVKRIDSFWFDDLRSHFLSAPTFPLEPASPLELLTHEKVTHHCYGAGQAEELRQIGIERISLSRLAASSDLIRAENPCTHRDKLAFVGNPGLPSAPGSAALAAMDRGESLVALRRVARQEVLDALSATEPTAAWLRQSPGARGLLEAATELRLAHPHTAAITLLMQAGRSFRDDYDFLNRNGHVLDAALLVKLVNRYDRPALVRRLWQRGWLEVYGAPEQWKPFGIDARPTVSFPHLAAIYQRHPAHLNAPNCARDASANEKLFEIAACARLSLNLDSPDLRACYDEGEIVLAQSEEALEAAAETVLRDPEAALAAGAKARHRTEREHLWEHRLGKALR